MTARCAILAYHSLDTSGSVVSIEPAVFADQMAWLSDAGFRGVSLSEAVRAREATGRWPDRSVVITFDDGFASVHDVALPILVRHGFSATVFLVNDYVGGHNDWETPPSGLGRRPVVSWSQARELADAGWELGGHTRTHPDLQVIDPARVDDEIIAGKREIEDRLGRAVETFAYPYGRSGDAALRAVRREFRAACTTVLKRAGDEDLHRLPRFDMFYGRSLRVFRGVVEGRLDGYLTVRRWGRSLRRRVAGSSRSESGDTSSEERGGAVAGAPPPIAKREGLP